MLRLLGLCLTFCLLITCCILLARGVGSLRGPTGEAAALRLGECSLPCWLHLIPGETPAHEVLQTLDQRYVTADFPEPLLVKADGLTSVRGVLSLAGSGWSAPVTVEYFDGRLLRTDLLLESHSLQVGDVLAASGLPTCVTLFAGRLSGWTLIYHEPDIGTAYLYVAGSDSLRLTNHVIALVLSRATSGLLSECRNAGGFVAGWHGTAPRWRYNQLAASTPTGSLSR